jgi:REP element-mobilizing transposase RayT
MWPSNPPRIKAFPYRGCRRYLITMKIPPFFAARNFEVLAYCVMPDHLHLLLEGTSEDADLREAVRAWKQWTGYDWKQRTGSRLWQPGFHDRVMRDGDDARAVVAYVLRNPVRGPIGNAEAGAGLKTGGYVHQALAKDLSSLGRSTGCGRRS